ncbi:uncharacterized protein [Spinacia oleracea]|uniref:Uncharacterized protein isoform X2 n=1 Tax=Spinacia oleracea TaxID=3562 RepID=A0A9R0J9B2_SPIOL|nr:uncharacterized protein LOC110801342 isoform X2 [Spinacia oleracea]
MTRTCFWFDFAKDWCASLILDVRQAAPPNPEETGAEAAQTAVVHGIDLGVEFKPVEHPVEPLDNDKPVQCPLPEPSILNDGRIWKERVSAVRRRSDVPVATEGSGGDLISEIVAGGGGTTNSQPPPARRNRMMLPSISAPEHNLVNMLEECKASGMII